MFKKKKVNVAKELTEMISKLNFDVPNEKIEEIDSKLNVLLNNMEYDDYLNFINSDNKLKTYDNVLGMYANNDEVSKVLVKNLTGDYLMHVEKLVDNKIKELNLQ